MQALRFPMIKRIGEEAVHLLIAAPRASGARIDRHIDKITLRREVRPKHGWRINLNRLRALLCQHDHPKNNKLSTRRGRKSKV